MKPTATLERISPKQAREILDTANSENFRKMDKDYVRNLAKAMGDGNWDVNGEPLIFDSNGNLIDGQHRLAACAESGKTLETIVVRGVDPTYVRSIDVGRKRTIAMLLSSRGVKFSNNVAAAVRLYKSYEMGERGKTVYHSQIPPQDVLDFLTERKLSEMYELLNGLTPCRRFCSLSIMVGMTMIGFDKYSRVKVLEWAYSVANLSAPVGSPAQRLSKRLHDEYAASSSGHANRWIQTLLMARSMKAHCEGTQMDKLIWGKSKTAILPEFGSKKVA